jgi:hypothetical protein
MVVPGARLAGLAGPGSGAGGLQMDTRFAKRLAGTLGVLALAGCAAVGPEISTDLRRAVDFSQYATFAFMDRAERGQSLTYDTIGDRRVIAA